VLPALVVGLLGAGVPLLLVRMRAERLHTATQMAVLDAIRLVRDAVYNAEHAGPEQHHEEGRPCEPGHAA